VTAFDGAPSGIVRAAGSLGPVVNSAGVVFDPPLMVDAYETVFRISGVRQDYWLGYTDGFANHINNRSLMWSDAFRVTYSMADDVFETWTLKVSVAAASFFRQGDQSYWRYNYEIRYREREGIGPDLYPAKPWDGWLAIVIDRGYSRWAGPGADDGFGGSISANDIEDGMAPLAAIRGPMGERLPEPALLDGKGVPLGDGFEPVELKYRVNPEAELSGIPLNILVPGS
jgi:hypothetical protein